MNNETSTITPQQKLPCQYEDNPTSAEALCELWCQLELYNGKVCDTMMTTTSAPCPYISIVEEPRLCHLWNQVQSLSNMLTTTTQSGSYQEFCPYHSQTHSQELCKLWCEVQGYYSVKCVECPTIYLGEPQHELVCNLWLELTNTNNSNSMVTTTGMILYKQNKKQKNMCLNFVMSTL